MTSQSRSHQVASQKHTVLTEPCCIGLQMRAWSLNSDLHSQLTYKTNNTVELPIRTHQIKNTIGKVSDVPKHLLT